MAQLRSLPMLLVLACCWPARAQEPLPPSGLHYCAPPIKPACVDDDETYQSPARKAACQKDMDRFVPTVFAYRQCLNSEMERAVRQTNDMLQRFRCRANGDGKCP